MLTEISLSALSVINVFSLSHVSSKFVHMLMQGEGTEEGRGIEGEEGESRGRGRRKKGGGNEE